MRYLDSRVNYTPEYRHVIPSIITHREIPLEDSIHELGKVYLSIYPQIAHFSGIGKEVRPFALRHAQGSPAHSVEIRWRGGCVREAFRSSINLGSPPVLLLVAYPISFAK